MTPANQTTVATTECYNRERKIWDDLLNENFRALRDDLDEGQKGKLRDMQRAWIAYRDTTCGFYHDRIPRHDGDLDGGRLRGARTARRALLLKLLQGL